MNVKLDSIFKKAKDRKDGLLLEFEAYEVLSELGFKVPKHYFYSAKDLSKGIALPKGVVFVAKAMLDGETHKTERGAVSFDITNENAEKLINKWQKDFSAEEFKGILFVEELNYEKGIGNELLFGFYQDDFFGPVVTLGIGGSATEYFGKTMKAGFSNIFISADEDINKSKNLISKLSAVEFLEGHVRGSKKVANVEDIIEIVEKVKTLAKTYSESNENSDYVITEFEVNPAVVKDGKFVALDAVLRVKDKNIKQSKKNISYIENLLAPKSAAIAGASAKNPFTPAGIILKKFLSFGMKNEDIFILHPKEPEVMGIKAYSSLDEIKKARNNKPVDIFVVGIPAESAVGVMTESFDKNIAKSYQVITAGFGEIKSGEARQKEIENKLASMSIETRPVVNGPNTLGNIYLKKYDTLFTPQHKSSSTGKGKENVALICQSGAFMITRLSDLANIVFPKMSVSVGNQLDLTVVDFLEFGLENHKDIDVFALYIEGFKKGDGLRLINLANKALEKNKLVVVYKAGRTKEGQEAAKGHTAAQAGDYQMFADFVERAGGIVARTLIEFQNIIMAGSLCPGIISLKKKNVVNVSALSNAGFEKCALADNLTLGSSKIRLAEISSDTIQKIKMAFERCRMTGIMDLHSVLDLTPMCDDLGYYEIMSALLEDKNVDVGMFSIVPETVMMNTLPKSDKYKEDFAKEGGLLELLKKLKTNSKKPFLMNLESGEIFDPLYKEILNLGIPCFRYADSSARVLERIVGC